MSVKCMAWVLEHSEARLSDRLVLLALAEYAHDDGSMAFPSVETLAMKARVGESTARKSLRKLEDDAEIQSMGKTKFGTTIYRVLMGEPPTDGEGGPESSGGQNRAKGGQNRAKGGQNRATGGQDLAPIRQEPSGTVNRSESARARARDPSPMKVGGRSVDPELWALTADVLTEYNAQAGTKLRLLTSAGKPSEAAKRVYSRIATYPDIPLTKHADIIARTLASRWWGDGPPSIGVVYGPNVFEDNIARPAATCRANGKRERDRMRLGALARLMGADGAREGDPGEA